MRLGEIVHMRRCNFLLAVTVLLCAFGCSSLGAKESNNSRAPAVSQCPELTGRYQFIGEPLPGGRPLSGFNSKLTVANVAFVGGNEFVLEVRVPYFDLVQVPSSIAINFHSPDGSAKHFVMNGPTDELTCTSGEVIIRKDFESAGEGVSGHMYIVHKLSVGEDGALVVKTDKTGWTRVFFIPLENSPEAYYAKFARVHE